MNKVEDIDQMLMLLELLRQNIVRNDSEDLTPGEMMEIAIEETKRDLEKAKEKLGNDPNFRLRTFLEGY